MTAPTVETSLAEASAALDTPPDLTVGNLCTVCGEPIEKPKRGRPPKIHPHCRKESGKADSYAAPRKSAGSWPRANAVENALNQLFEYGALGLSMIHLEKDGVVVAAGGPAVSKALVDLGREDRKLRKILETLTAPGKYGPLTMAVAAIVIPVMANHNLLPQISLFGDAGTPGRSEP